MGLHIDDLDPLTSWYYAVISRQSRRKHRLTGLSDVHYYEFGVGIRTFGRYLKALRLFCEKTGNDMARFHALLFDSFQGLPPWKTDKDRNVEWGEGSFRTTLPELKTRISTLGFNPDASNIHYIAGFFEETLTKSRREQLQSLAPSIITIDVDYYSSTKLILSWLRPILRSGTVFYFDDVWAFDGNPRMGQLAAINEFNKRNRRGLATYTEFPVGGCSYIYWCRAGAVR